MECPKCGADNPEGSEFCSLCLAPLPRMEPMHVEGIPRSSSYIAPGEWRGDPEILRSASSSIVERKMHRLYVRLGIYAFVTLGIVAWLALSLTVWGNPSPATLASRLIQALNARDAAAFNAMVMPESGRDGESVYGHIMLALGSDGKFEKMSFKAGEADNYTARVSITGGEVNSTTFGKLDLAGYSSLVLVFQNLKGKWYFDPGQSILLPY